MADDNEWQTDETRQRIITLAFGRDESKFESFRESLRGVTALDASAILRGSAVTGKRWKDGHPFDGDGPGSSDLDVTFIGGNMLKLWNSFHIVGIHTVPLSEAHPDACPPMVPVRESLCKLAGRPVNLQATTEFVQFARDILMDQPYYTLIEERAKSET